jgi:V8-like Glu-specific endopeptidase
VAAEERATFERELRDLGIAPPPPVAAEITGSGDRRELEILPPDERRYWSGTLVVPYRWICSIEVYRSNPKWGAHGQARWLLHGKGTGVLIGADCVLTAAHILWREESGEPRRVDRVVVIPARDGKTKPLGSVEAADWRTPAGWDPGRQQRRWDFAVIRLKDAIGNKSFKALGDRQLGWWGSTSLGGGTSLKPLQADWLLGRRVISTGYPGDKCGTRSLADQAAIDRCVRDEPELWASTQWWAEGTVRAVHAAVGLLHHTIDTHEGQSGSPVWYYWRDEKQGQSRRWLVGLHVAPGTIQIDAQGNQRRVDNMAVWLSQDVLDAITRLCTALGAATGAGAR